MAKSKRNPMVNWTAFPPGFYQEYDPDYRSDGYYGEARPNSDRPWDYMRDTYSLATFPTGACSTNNGLWNEKYTGVARYNPRKETAFLFLLKDRAQVATLMKVQERFVRSGWRVDLDRWADPSGATQAWQRAALVLIGERKSGTASPPTQEDLEALGLWSVRTKGVK